MSTNLSISPPDIIAEILVNVVADTGSLECRRICKSWKEIIDTNVWNLLKQRISLANEIDLIPTGLGLRSIVMSYKENVNTSIVAFVHLDIKIKKTIGIRAVRVKKLTTSSIQLKNLTSKIPTNLHHFWYSVVSSESEKKSNMLRSFEELSELYFNDQVLTSIIFWTGIVALADRNLTWIPQEFFILERLETLAIEQNLLTNLPSEISLLTNLQNINLRHNKITNITPRIDSLTKLKKLTLNNNLLTNLPSTIVALTNLEELNLKNNPSLPPLSEEITSKLPNTKIEQ